jgi:hypothetical protein
MGSSWEFASLQIEIPEIFKQNLKVGHVRIKEYPNLFLTHEMFAQVAQVGSIGSLPLKIKILVSEYALNEWQFTGIQDRQISKYKRHKNLLGNPLPSNHSNATKFGNWSEAIITLFTALSMQFARLKIFIPSELIEMISKYAVPRIPTVGVSFGIGRLPVGESYIILTRAVCNSNKYLFAATKLHEQNQLLCFALDGSGDHLFTSKLDYAVHTMCCHSMDDHEYLFLAEMLANGNTCYRCCDITHDPKKWSTIKPIIENHLTLAGVCRTVLHKTVLSSPRASLLLITRMDNGLNRQYTLSVLGQRVSTKLPFLESEWTRHGGHLYVYDNESPELLHSMWLSTAPYSSMIVTKSNLLLGLDVHSKQIHTFILNSHCHSSKVPAKPQTKNVLNFLSESSFLYEMDDVVLVIDHIGASPLIISE